MIQDKYQIPAVSTGHLLRQEAAAGSELGQQAASYTSKGQLAPDALVMAVLKQWMKSGLDSYVFDGFPRTVAQAVQLEPMLAEARIPLEIVLFLKCDFSTIEKRVSGRVTCSGCQTIFQVGLHVTSAEQACPKCSGKLERRADDQPEVLQQRMVQYAQKTEPLVEHYQANGLLHVINGNGEFDGVFAQIERALLS